MAKEFTHPNLGHEVRVVRSGRTVALVFTCDSQEKADSFAEDILRQLKEGALNLTLLGKPTGLTEENW